MPRFVKDYMATDAKSSVAKVQPNTAYVVGDIRRAAQTIFVRCTQAGTTAVNSTWHTTFDASYYTDEFTNGTTKWACISGLSGYSADAWEFAAMMYILCPSTGAQPIGGIDGGLLYNTQAHGDTLYMAKTDVHEVTSSRYSDMAEYSLYAQFYDVNEWYWGEKPHSTDRQPPLPYLPLSLISSDDTVPTTTTPAYSKGHTLLFQDKYLGMGHGANIWKGIIFAIDSSVVLFRSDRIAGGDSGAFTGLANTRHCSVNTFIDCDFNLYGERVTGYHPGLIFGEYPTIDAGFLTLDQRGGQIEKREFESCNFNFTLQTAVLSFAYACNLFACNFDTSASEFNPEGTLRLWYRVGSEITLTSCNFLKPMKYLFSYPPIGCAHKYVLEGCTFVGTDLTKLLGNITSNYNCELTVDLYGCGVAGSLNPASHLRLSPLYTLTKQLNIARAGAIPDWYNNPYSYHIKTADYGLVSRLRMEEAPHLQRSLVGGLYEISVYLKVPPDQLLNNDDFFIYVVGPDREWTVGSYPSYAIDGDAVASCASTRRGSLSSPAVTYPVVPMTWVGTPVGWVTQKVSVVLSVENSGRVYCVPLFAKPGAEFIMCGTLELARIMQ